MGNNNFRKCAKFTISFDCEGKWGVADQGDHTLEYINGSALREAYRRILILLRQYDVSASFGFVGALCLNPGELKDRIDAIESLTYNGQDWLLPVRQDIERKIYDGWAHPEILEMLMNERGHELCSHGGFHIPYDENNTSIDSVRIDLALISEIKQKKQLNFKNIILPRNVIGYKKLLHEAGFEGYREIDVREVNSGFFDRLRRLSHEFIIDDLKDILPVNDMVECDVPISLSSAKFLNARIGIRKIVPGALTYWRVRRFLDYAISANLRVHFYTHPHNFIRDSGLFYTFERILRLVSDRRDSGDLDIITMEDELEERYGIFNSKN